MARTETVTHVSLYIGGAVEKELSQPGFYTRLRELVEEFGGNPERTIIAIDESEVEV